ncbi:mitochondrial inner membrane protease ATP23 homolog [Strongylocentrotus purpuratus]|uniref:Mitochondrial inner membrane protease ATP23 n=1 Tax=Strongylocentrotus purpuratus TaxID=7668 RepID=A0A7M7RAA0_STRPU|nr:mitochondrial inner membrane protease ATP23 homolog [Strongylocentrotus purpuratus]|eukprot:XP_783122.2 PREDICTED: mitochondrial inner membrane protease ATP23 homolog [Strongylocentrotus purpuratus]
MAAPMDEHATSDISSKTSEKDDKTDVDQSNITKRSWKEKRIHTNCIERADFACKHNPYVKFMLAAMEQIGCPIDPDTHIVCEPCASDSPVNGGFDPINGEIVLCENKSPSQRILSTLLTHELIHAYDHCRAKVDWTDIRHVACSEIRASSLSGDCSFLSDSLYSWNFRFKNHHQTCVRRRAIGSILAVRNVSREEAEKAVDGVWETCFKDYAPFTTIPRRLADLKTSSHDQSHDQKHAHQPDR